jgi:hypothetical protein
VLGNSPIVLITLNEKKDDFIFTNLPYIAGLSFRKTSAKGLKEN